MKFVMTRLTVSCAKVESAATGWTESGRGGGASEWERDGQR